MKKFPKTQVLSMMLSNLYVADGQHDKAVETQINFTFSHQEFQLSHLESTLSDFSAHFVPRDREQEETTENFLQL